MEDLTSSAPECVSCCSSHGSEQPGQVEVPTSFEVATSWLSGLERTPQGEHAAASPTHTGISPRAAIEDLVLQQSGKTVFVAFSGGRDSSAILAIAVDVARRHGLDDPVPITEAFPGNPAAEERQWQELVLRYLGVRNWDRLDVGADSDLVGESAQRSLNQNGVMWPPAVHVKAQLLAAARGGVLLTGEGGDEVLGATRSGPVRELLVERQWRGRPHVRALAKQVPPRWVRRRLVRRHLEAADLQPWLTAEAKHRHIKRLSADLACEPMSRSHAICWLCRRRAVTVAGRSRCLIAARADVDLIDPLLDPGVVSALAGRAGFWGWRGRYAALRDLAGDLLPEAVLARQSKALFNSAYFGEASRAFAHHWDGSGLDPALVDAGRLRDEWLSREPSALTFLPLHAAWVHARGRAAAS